MPMINFFLETRRFIDQATPFLKDDIIFIGDSGLNFGCTWNKFSEMANVEYDNTVIQTGQDSDLTTIPRDLIIAFHGGGMMIREVRFSVECWRLVFPFDTAPGTEPLKLKRLFIPRVVGKSVNQLNRT